MDAGIACATAWGRQPQKRGMNAPEKFTMKKTLTKADIVEAIYEETDKNRVDVKNVVEQLLEIMKTAIKKDRALLISGFGKFECYDMPPAKAATRRRMKPSPCRRAKSWSSACRANSVRNSILRAIHV